MTEPSSHPPRREPGPTADELREVSAALRGLRFGVVQIIVQDGVVVQIERTEKQRLRTKRTADY